MIDAQTSMRWISLAGFIIAAFFVGLHVGDVWKSVSDVDAPVYSSGYFDQAFFDGAYRKASGAQVDGVISGLVAHHLLVADKIAEVFQDAARDDVRTVIVVSPNHFSLGGSAAQVSTGTWSTPYGMVYADTDAIAMLLAVAPDLRHDESAAPHEHGVGALTPFVARSFPHAKIVPIILDESLSADAALALGETLARELPDAVLFASVDMTHYHDADYTAVNDDRALDALARGSLLEPLDIDSNASMRVLFAFNAVRTIPSWHLTHHGSSLAMGATDDWHENTSHILGYFTKTQ